MSILTPVMILFSYRGGTPRGANDRFSWPASSGAASAANGRFSCYYALRGAVGARVPCLSRTGRAALRRRFPSPGGMCCNRSREAIAALKIFNSCRNSASTLPASMSGRQLLSGEMKTARPTASPLRGRPAGAGRFRPKPLRNQSSSRMPRVRTPAAPVRVRRIFRSGVQMQGRYPLPTAESVFAFRSDNDPIPESPYASAPFGESGCRAATAQ